MNTIKLTYLLEIEVPADTLLTDGNAYAQAVHRLLRWNEPRGWKARLRRLVGVQKGHESKPRVDVVLRTPEA